MQPGMVPGMAPGMPTAAAWHIAMDWTEDEQRTLEEHLQRFPPERYDALQRYVKLAAVLPRKTVRDVALRCKWTINQQLLKKRKLEAAGGKVPLGVAKKPGGPGTGPKPPLMPMPLPVPAVGAPMPGSMPPPFLPPGAQPQQSAGGASAAAAEPGGLIVDGPIAQLLEANYGILNQFRANMAAFKVAENTQLLTTFRDNILTIITHMENMGGVMDQMPQLPVRLNLDLANNFLPSRPAVPMPASYGGSGGASLPPQPAVNIPGMVPLNGFAPGSGTASAAPPAAAVPQPPQPQQQPQQQQQQQQPAPPAPAAPAGFPPSTLGMPPASVPLGMPMPPKSSAPAAGMVPSPSATHPAAAASPPLPTGAVPVAAVPPPALKQEPGTAAAPQAHSPQATSPAGVPSPAAAAAAVAAAAVAAAGAPASPGVVPPGGVASPGGAP